MVLGCAEINVAIRRAIAQYGRKNVTVTAPFLKLLAAHTFSRPEKRIEYIKTAYLAPIDLTLNIITPENVQWALPLQKDTNTIYMWKLGALNRARRQLGLDPIAKITKNRTTAGIAKKRIVALAVARYFFLRRYNVIGTPDSNRQLTLEDIYKALDAAA